MQSDDHLRDGFVWQPLRSRVKSSYEATKVACEAFGGQELFPFGHEMFPAEKNECSPIMFNNRAATFTSVYL